MENTFYVSNYDGVTDDDKIRVCMQEAMQCKNPTVVFSGRSFEVSNAILLTSGMTILVDDCTIRQKDGAFDNVFRGANIHLDPAKPTAEAVAIEPLSDVRLLGRGNAVIQGCAQNRRAVHPVLQREMEMTGDYWGFLTYQVLLVCTDKIEISGLHFRDTRGWAITLDLCTRFHIHTVRVDSDVKNGDGIHLLSGCSDGVIENITGSTSDDMIAVQSGFSLPTLPYKNYLAPFTPSGVVSKSLQTRDLDCHHLVIRNITAGGKMHNIILLALNETCIHHVEIENIRDENRQEPYFATVFLYTGIYGAPGTLRDISVKNVCALADTAFVSNTTIHNLLLSDITTQKENGKLYGTFPLR